jgi:hypothetical protein
MLNRDLQVMVTPSGIVSEEDQVLEFFFDHGMNVRHSEEIVKTCLYPSGHARL